MINFLFRKTLASFLLPLFFVFVALIFGLLCGWAIVEGLSCV